MGRSNNFAIFAAIGRVSSLVSGLADRPPGRLSATRHLARGLLGRWHGRWRLLSAAAPDHLSVDVLLRCRRTHAALGVVWRL